MQPMKKLILWGATGQSIVLEEFLGDTFNLVALFDNNRSVTSPFPDVPLYYGWDGFDDWLKNQSNEQIYFAVAIGGQHGNVRQEIHETLQSKGLQACNAIHPTAYVAKGATLLEGCQLLPMAVVGARTKLGTATIINTSAHVDHECVIGKGVHVGPGAHLAGCITVGDYSFIGTGAVVLPWINIGKNSIVGAGSVVTRDVPDNSVVYGNPCRIKKENLKPE